MIQNLFLLKGDFSFGKSQKSQGTKSGLFRGWVTWVIRCFAKKLCSRCDAWERALLWWSCQLPAAHSRGLLNYPSSFCGGMFKLIAKFDVDPLLYSPSHCECDSHTIQCSLHGIYHPHWLVQWSRPCSHVHIPVPSPWLPGYRSHWCHTNIILHYSITLY